MTTPTTTPGAAAPSPQTTITLYRSQVDLSPELVTDAKTALERISEACAKDLDSAYERFVRWRRKDPFPDVPPALLTSAEVCNYIIETGMLVNCPLNEKTVKLASLDFPLLGKVIYWEQGRRKKLDLQPGQAFRLEKNSIAFFTLQPYLMLPDYIAMRFNFRIRNVYRGLLLGTGPLVDPGFQGRLSFPIHNLTSADWDFTGGEGIITAEFTKIGVPKYRPNVVHDRFKEADERQERYLPIGLRSTAYMPYPEPEKIAMDPPGRDVIAFLEKAGTDEPIVSSLAPLRQALIMAQKTVEHVRETVNRISLVGAASLVLGFAGFSSAIYAAWSYADHSAKDAREEVQHAQHDQARLTDSLRVEQARLTLEMRSLRDSLQALAKRTR